VFQLRLGAGHVDCRRAHRQRAVLTVAGMGAPTDSASAAGRVRLDKWLWAARFFKTRSQAATAVKGGHVRLNGQRAKSSAGIGVGDRLRVTKGPIVFVVDVVDLSDKR